MRAAEPSGPAPPAEPTTAGRGGESIDEYDVTVQIAIEDDGATRWSLSLRSESPAGTGTADSVREALGRLRGLLPDLPDVTDPAWREIRGALVWRGKRRL